MLTNQLKFYGISNPNLLQIFKKVPRHLFIPEKHRTIAYGDHPVSIGYGQTISQPYMVALMTELLELEKGKKVLEIGTGSGYQAAILAEVVGPSHVYTIEIIEALGLQARKNLVETGYDEVHCRIGDGFYGWSEQAPFESIIITAAVEDVPPPLITQLAEGGTFLVPVDNLYSFQILKILKREKGKIVQRDSISCRFVPFLGKHGKKKFRQ